MSRSNLRITYSSEDIMNASNNGYDIFVRELGSVNPRKNISNPFIKDRNPSCRVKQSKTSGIWMLKCYNDDGWMGNAISFIQRRYSLTFKEAIDKIAVDLGLSDTINKEYTPIAKTENIKPVTNTKLFVEYEKIPFTKVHADYWGVLTEEHLNSENIFAISKIAINKKVTEIPKNEISFVYIPDGNEIKNGVKQLRIGKNVTKQDKWRSYNMPNSFLWNYSKYKDKKVKRLFVLKSRKDELIFNLLGFNTISVQSENGHILDENMPKILPLADEIVLVMGSDEQGVNMCKPIQKKYNVRYYNTPKNLLPLVNDPFSFYSAFSLNALKNHLKTKKLL